MVGLREKYQIMFCMAIWIWHLLMNDCCMFSANFKMSICTNMSVICVHKYMSPQLWTTSYLALFSWNKATSGLLYWEKSNYAYYSRLNPGAQGEHLAIHLSWMVPSLLVKRVCPVHLVERLGCSPGLCWWQ